MFVIHQWRENRIFLRHLRAVVMSDSSSNQTIQFGKFHHSLYPTHLGVPCHASTIFRGELNNRARVWNQRPNTEVTLVLASILPPTFIRCVSAKVTRFGEYSTPNLGSSPAAESVGDPWAPHRPSRRVIDQCWGHYLAC
jgi:hypothetical protein